MELELNGSEEVVQSQIVDLLVVVNVVNFNFKSLLLLEEVVDCDFCDEVRVKRVVYDFSLSNLDPLISLRFKKNKEGIRKTECIHVREICASKGQRELLRGTSAAKVRSCEDCGVNIGAESEFGSPIKNKGNLALKNIKVERRHSFLEYVFGGCDIDLSIAIDFTLSNRPPNDPSSLHFFDPKKNQYLQVI